ncbi:short chain dehydrogenase [Parafilimonas sp.]|uniref:short chain dehydrogenase n=1 Tax=Parafilimonas sp. TaxID=1969739 RepID=UPI0039E28D24
MKILAIGASGEVGSIITPALKEKYEVITAGRNSGDLRADISFASSIENLYKQTGKLDAVVNFAGNSITFPLNEMTEERYNISVVQKLLSQINLVLIGLNYINNNGSFTLISGIMGEKPKAGTSGKSIANGGINSFVLSASLEMSRNIRLNVVSPGWVKNIPAEDMIAGYLKSVETQVNGEIIRIGYIV